VQLEPHVLVAGAREDTNVYFRRGYFLALKLGIKASVLDTIIQFSISPLAEVQHVFEWLGLRRGLEDAVADERQHVLARLERGAPFADESREPCREHSEGSALVPFRPRRFGRLQLQRPARRRGMVRARAAHGA
jgi:hypothetical protein